jgi:hypothetical protein
VALFADCFQLMLLGGVGGSDVVFSAGGM